MSRMIWKSVVVCAGLLSGSVGAAPAHDLAQLAAQEKQSTVTDRQETVVHNAKLAPFLASSLYSIIYSGKLWPHSPITVCFGPQNAAKARAALIAQISAIANEWLVGLPYRFDFGSPGYRVCQSLNSADIRVDISQPADESGAIFQSLIGTDAVGAGIDGDGFYSMQLLFPDDQKFKTPTVVRFYVLHEFGHALGAGHEHQRVACKFDYSFIARTFNFPSAADARANMGKEFDYRASAYPETGAIEDSQFISTKYDNYSVMKYNLGTTDAPGGDDLRVYTDGKNDICYRGNWVSTLTAYDKAGIAKAYGSLAHTQELIAGLQSLVSLNRPAGAPVAGGEPKPSSHTSSINAQLATVRASKPATVIWNQISKLQYPKQ